MAYSPQVTTRDLWADGRALTITLTKPTPTSLLLTWTPPANPVAYDGAVVVVSEGAPVTADNYPIDGTKYTGSTAWGTPATGAGVFGTIGTAQVVAAFYGFFGDDTTQSSVTVTGIDPNKVYYASIHAASNVLQYYTIGSQSYPLAPAPASKQSTNYAGSIPASATAPLNPTNGQVYFDPKTNMVMVWNGDMGAWLAANQNTVPVGLLPPLSPNQLFVNYIQVELKFFDGNQWNLCTPTNTRVKMGNAWAPFHQITQGSAYPQSPTVGDFIYLTIPAVLSAPSSAVIKFYSLGAWFNPDASLIQVSTDNGVTWNNVVVNIDELYDTQDPPVPAVGDFFYSTADRALLAWSGTEWVRADTEEQGVATTDKIGIGDNGDSYARDNLIETLKIQLGYPQVCVEIGDGGFQVAVNNALDTFRQLADNAYKHAHISYTIIQNQVKYYLNDPRDQTDKIVNVIKIHRINQLGISSLSAETGLYAQAFFNQLYQGSNVDVLSIHLMNQLSKNYEKIFAGNLMFTWDEATRELLILRRILQAQERVVLECVMERSEQELLTDRWCKQWLREWAEADLLEQLGLIRSKYGSLPGANGGLTLNGDTLLGMSSEKKAELRRQINDFEVGNGGAEFQNTTFMIG